jgi:hypothetical protein
MRSPGRTLLALLAAIAVAGWLAAPPRVHAQATQAPNLLPLAQAYTAAWNAHDLDAVLAFFVPDAIVRERRGDVPLEVWDAHDPQVVGAYLNATLDGNNLDPTPLRWVTGHQQIGAWATARFARRHRVAVGQYHVIGDTVRWPYQEGSDPFQSMPGVGLLEGTTEAEVRGGRITLLTVVLSPASVALLPASVVRQQQEVASVATQTMASQRPIRSPIIGDGASGQARGPLRDGPAAAEPTTLAWPLALGGLALLAFVTASLRRRQASQP